MINKLVLRKQNLETRLQMSKITKYRYDLKIMKQIKKSDDFLKAKIIALFAPIKQEPNLNKLIKFCWKNQKIVVLPRMQPEQQLLFYQIKRFQDLIVDNSYHILQPKITCPIIATKQIDICFVPLLAYDLQGNRVGYGKGYYDRTLKKFNNLIIGVGYSWQESFEGIQTNEFDILLTKMITEKKIVNFKML